MTQVKHLALLFDFGGVLTASPFMPLKEYTKALWQHVILQQREQQQPSGEITEKELFPCCDFFLHVNKFASLKNSTAAQNSSSSWLELEEGKITRSEFLQRFLCDAKNFMEEVINDLQQQAQNSNLIASSKHFDLSSELRQPYLHLAKKCIRNGASFLSSFLQLIDPEVYVNILERCPIRQNVLEFLDFIKKEFKTINGVKVTLGIITNNWLGYGMEGTALSHEQSYLWMLQSALMSSLSDPPTQEEANLLFDFAVQSYEVQSRKPKKDIFVKALERVQEFTPKNATTEVFFFDDILGNVEAASSISGFDHCFHVSERRSESKAVHMLHLELLKNVSTFLDSQMGGAEVVQKMKKFVFSRPEYCRGIARLTRMPPLPTRANLVVIPPKQQFSPQEWNALCIYLKTKMPNYFQFGNLTSASDRSGSNNIEDAVMTEYFQGGMSNPTFRFTARTGSYVLRKQPKGKLLRGAHDMKREISFFNHLRQHSKVPVPHCLLYGDDVSVMGTTFFVMKYKHGYIFQDLREMLPSTTKTQTRSSIMHIFPPKAYFFSALDTLMDLQAAPIPSFLRSSKNNPTGATDSDIRKWPITRVILTWFKQYQGAIQKLAEHQKILENTSKFESPRLPAFEKLTMKLQEKLQSGQIPLCEKLVISHGDYKLDNIMFEFPSTTGSSPKSPKVCAVLDFELTSVGDPLADVAYMSLFQHIPPPRGLLGIRQKEITSLFPSGADILNYYCEKSGALANIPNVAKKEEIFRFYQAAMCHKLTGIGHGVWCRALVGNASDVKGGLKLRKMCDYLTDAGLKLLSAKEPSNSSKL